MKSKEDIFNSLIEENKDRIFRICCCYVQNPEDRNDIYQESLMNIWKGLKTFRGDAAFSTWIYRITVNTALQFLSKQRGARKKTEQYSNLVKTEGEINEYDNHAEINLLHKCVSKLPLLDMIIISLVLEDMNSKDIAKITGLTNNNVRTRIHRSKVTLKKLMEGVEI